MDLSTRPGETWRRAPRATGGAPAPGGHSRRTRSALVGITFDLDDTLYDNGPVLARAEQAVQGWLERNYPRLAAQYDAAALQTLRSRIARERPELRHDVTGLRKQALAVAAGEVGYPAELAEEAFRVFWVARNRVELFADTLPVLTRLRRHLILGALTNGNADVTQIGLGEVFHFAFCAADVGASKPEPPLFREALRRIGSDPRRTVHVGDDAIADIGGARAMGLRTVWLNRTGRSWEGEAPADAEIRTLWELPAVLERFEAEG